jgi:hypothetical protein
MGARICPRCSTRVDERRAKASPFCLSCGAPLGAPSSGAFAAKQGGGGGSLLPWILGGIALVVLLGVGGVIALIAVVANAAPDPVPVAGPAAQPKVEAPSTATASPTSVKTATPPTVTPTVRPTVVATAPIAPTSPPTTPTTPIPTPPRPTSTPTAIPTPPPTASVATIGPFDRARAQAEVDRIGFGLASCKRATGPFGAGSIRIDFQPDGRVGTLSRAPFSGTPVGACISARFLAIRLGPFTGSTQQIEKAFIIQE